MCVAWVTRTMLRTPSRCSSSKQRRAFSAVSRDWSSDQRSFSPQSCKARCAPSASGAVLLLSAAQPTPPLKASGRPLCRASQAP